MKKYLFQRFLPNCDTDDINLDRYKYLGNRSAFKVPISDLDETIDTEENFINYLHRFSPGDTIVLIYDRPDYQNPVLRDYAFKTLKSYLHWFWHFGYECYWEHSGVT